MKSILVLLFLVTILRAMRSRPTACPNVDDIQPCTCKQFAYGLHVTCRYFNSSHSLQNAFQVLQDYKVHTVQLYKLYISETLPSDLFSKMQLRELKIDSCNLKFSDRAFVGLENSLNILSVAENSRIKSADHDNQVGKFSLAKLSNLNELLVQKNGLQQISDTWLNKKVPKIEILVLDSNDIMKVEPNAFSTLYGIKSLSMSENRIKKVYRSMLPSPARDLTRIDLSFNELVELPEDFFHVMPSLKEVVLTQNYITTLPVDTWIPIWEQLDQLLLYETKLICDKKLDWIKGLHRPKQFEGICCDPPDMAGKPIREIFET